MNIKRNLNLMERFKSSPRHHQNKMLSSFILSYPQLSCCVTSFCKLFTRSILSISTDKRGPKCNANATQAQRSLVVATPLLVALFLPSLSFACDRGFTLFAGIGHDQGASNYQKNKDLQGEKYRDTNQGVFGFEYNARYWRAQFFHSSSLDNKEKSSFGDVNMLTVQFKWDPKIL